MPPGESPDTTGRSGESALRARLHALTTLPLLGTAIALLCFAIVARWMDASGFVLTAGGAAIVALAVLAQRRAAGALAGSLVRDVDELADALDSGEANPLLTRRKPDWEIARLHHRVQRTMRERAAHREELLRKRADRLTLQLPGPEGAAFSRRFEAAFLALVEVVAELKIARHVSNAVGRETGAPRARAMAARLSASLDRALAAVGRTSSDLEAAARASRVPGAGRVERSIPAEGGRTPPGLPRRRPSADLGRGTRPSQEGRSRPTPSARSEHDEGQSRQPGQGQRLVE